MLKTENIEYLKENVGTFVLMFTADWCGPCAPAKKIINETCVEKNIPAFFLDVEECTKQAIQYNVTNLPTVMYFRYGEIADMLAGSIKESDVREML